MSLLLSLLLGALWIPVDSGPDTPSLALALGEDGRLYSAQAGVLLQRGPEGWRPVAQYAPTLSWDGDEISADGPFSRGLLHEVVQRAEAALESKGLELGAYFERELINALLLEIVTELDPPPDSLYRVYDMAPAPGGVWLATGGGLFRPGEPPRLVGRVLSLTSTKDKLYFTTPRGLFELEEGEHTPTLLREGAEVVVRWRDQLLFLDEGELLSLSGDVAAPPELLIRIASDGERLWGQGGEELWRFDGAAWSSCGPLPDRPTRLRASPAGLLIITEAGIYTTDPACQKIKPAPRSWIGQLRFTDALYHRGALWASTSHGLLRRGSAEEMNAARVSDFQRALRALPTLHSVIQTATEHQNLGRESQGYGSRPLWRYVLPSVRAAFSWDPSRHDENPTLLRGSGKLTVYPARFDYMIFAEWSVDLGAFAPQATEQQWAENLVSTGGTVEASLMDQSDELVLFAVEDAPTANDVDIDALVALQASALNRDRQRLNAQLRTLYRERTRLLYQLWLSDDGRKIVHIEPNPVGEEAGLSAEAISALLPPDWQIEEDGEALFSPHPQRFEVIATHPVNGHPLRHWATVELRPRPRREAVEWVLRMDEIDALLNAATGGEWVKLSANSSGALKE